MPKKHHPSSDFFDNARFKSGEKETLEAIARNFDSFPASTRQKMENFPNWIRHRDLARILYRAEIFKSILHVPGVIFECGVLYGGGVATWIHLSEIFEPVNFSRRVFGFDTFKGFPSVAQEDRPMHGKNPEYYKPGHFSVKHARDSLFELFPLIDRTRKIPQIPRGTLVEGDASKTVPKLLAEDKSIIISLLYLDMDLYEPTKKVLEACLPRMCKGAVIVFDELNCDDWPGETQALYETLDLNTVVLERSPYVPHISLLRL